MKKILFVISVIFFAQTICIAQSKEEKAVAAAVERLRLAMISGDKQELEIMVADALSYGHSSGLVEDKTAFVEKIVSGKSDFVTLSLLDQTIRVSGRTAIVRHILDADTNDSGKPGHVRLGVLQIWQKQGKNWKLLARQAVKTS
jgi:hypothetical protein